MLSITGNLVHITERSIRPAKITIQNNRIHSIEYLNENSHVDGFIIPGFIDSHVHIESSMLIPSEFARMAVVHGTVATISDPHEIANVCGIEGVRYMIENGKTVPFKFHFGAPSCVPATVFETAGASLGVSEVKELLLLDEVKYLAEMMNFPGVLHGDSEVLEKIKIAHELGKPVDGHAPGLRGELAKKYIAAGITTDHECFTAEEALDKLHQGMKILIREGSAAKNFEALVGLVDAHYGNMMFCSDDKHPDSLELGHINQLCARAVAKGMDVFKVLQVACINPVKHYKMDVGLLQIGDAADFIVVKNLKDFEVLTTYINGALVATEGKTLIQSRTASVINFFDVEEKHVTDFSIPYNNEDLIPVIEALDGQLITHKLMLPPKVEQGNMVSDVEQDILKIVVVNRYTNAPIAKAFIKNFGIKNGALASSVVHDSHNIVAVGVEDESLCKAVNTIIRHQGGVAVVNGREEVIVPLPVAGLMSTDDGYQVAAAYTAIDRLTKQMGSTLAAPFMTLSFMALLVIPALKLSDKGLFDGSTFEFVNGWSV